MKLSTIVRRIHLWAGVLLGVQVILWMLSGVVMTWYHIDLVRGERDLPAVTAVALEAEAYASPGGIIEQAGPVSQVTLRRFLGAPVYETDGPSGRAIYDARSGARLSPIGADQARRVAREGFAGDGDIVRLSLIDDPGDEYRGGGPLPVWRADFSDRLNTRIYVSPETGEIVRRRNDVWRLYDFFWMLHIMDYAEREDFNNPLVKAASAAGLVFAASGFIMLFFRQSWAVLWRDLKRLAGR